MAIEEAAKTRVLDTTYEISKQVIHLAHTSSGLSIVSVSGGMQLIYNNFFDYYKEILDKYKKGQGNGIRWVIDIQKESVELVRIFLDLGMQVRHVKNLSAMNFAVGDKEVNATIDKMEGGKMIQSLITSTEPIYVKHFYTIFEELWNKGIDAQKRICDIEEGIDETNIEIIPNPQEGIKNAWKIVKSARKEVSIIFSTANAFSRQIEMGGLPLLKEVSENHKAKVRILVPTTVNDDDDELSAIKQSRLSCPLIDIRSLEDNLQTKITIVVVDRKECLIVELKDDSKDNSYMAAGVSTYSNSRSIVSSYVSIFENLWNQTDLYEQLKKSNEQLKYLYDQMVASNEQMKISNKMQKEFINVAAHELRTPVQPILGLAELLHNKKQIRKEEEEHDKEFLTIIIRNARRLQQLTECILDITKIENQSLKLNKDQFSMNSLVLETFTDFRNQLKKEGKKKIKLTLALEEGDTSVVADKNRIIQVISNILNNAVKFTKEGNIVIATEKTDNVQEIRVKVKDTGPGIDPEVMPRLFSKFVTNSQIGTGLGLFISKSIIEAHGGKIWAENNSDGKGSVFTFSLPLNERSHVRRSSSSSN
ncbi:MAG TPA: HAMP domain-containing sensor histidine kinase [Nitrososphaeraceae archaeon]|jgi:signal transduction histidine kinase|nr:HAMP domain-containing sensor histidine kinase [Nitrososphaeraceae archaeon]